MPVFIGPPCPCGWCFCIWKAVGYDFQDRTQVDSCLELTIQKEKGNKDKQQWKRAHKIFAKLNGQTAEVVILIIYRAGR